MSRLLIVFYVLGLWNLMLVLLGGIGAIGDYDPGEGDKFNPGRVLVMIPAHNEESSVIETVLSVWAAGCFAVVIADRCTDGTVEGLVRHDVPMYIADQGNKGAALNDFMRESAWLIDHYDALAVVDCGSVVDEWFGSRLLDGLSSAAVVQSSLHSIGQLSWVNAWYSWNYGVYHLIAMGRSMLHLPAFIGGSGWGWRREMPVVFNERCLVEDLELSLLVHHVGLPIVYRDLGVYDEKPATLRASIGQRLRWERGEWWLIFHGRWVTWRFDDFAQVMGAPGAIVWAYFMIVALIHAPLVVLLFAVSYWLYGMAGLANLGDIERVRPSTLLAMPFMSILEGLISFVALLTWSRKGWYRTPHGTQARMRA